MPFLARNVDRDVISFTKSVLPLRSFIRSGGRILRDRRRHGSDRASLPRAHLLTPAVDGRPSQDGSVAGGQGSRAGCVSDRSRREALDQFSAAMLERFAGDGDHRRQLRAPLGLPLGEVLVAQEFITEEQRDAALAAQAGTDAPSRRDPRADAGPDATRHRDGARRAARTRAPSTSRATSSTPTSSNASRPIARELRVDPARGTGRARARRVRRPTSSSTSRQRLDRSARGAGRARRRGRGRDRVGARPRLQLERRHRRRPARLRGTCRGRVASSSPRPTDAVVDRGRRERAGRQGRQPHPRAGRARPRVRRPHRAAGRTRCGSACAPTARCTSS